MVSKLRCVSIFFLILLTVFLCPKLVQAAIADIPFPKDGGVIFPGSYVHYAADGSILRKIHCESPDISSCTVTNEQPGRENETPTQILIYDTQRRLVAKNFYNTDGSLKEYALLIRRIEDNKIDRTSNYDANNVLIYTETYHYDASGNRLGSTREYPGWKIIHFNERNQKTAHMVFESDGETPSFTDYYFYDDERKLIYSKRVVYQGGRVLFFHASGARLTAPDILLNRQRVSEESYERIQQHPVVGEYFQNISYNDFVNAPSTNEHLDDLSAAMDLGFGVDPARFVELMSHLKTLIFFTDASGEGAPGILKNQTFRDMGIIMTSFKPTDIQDLETRKYNLLGIVAHESKHLLNQSLGTLPEPTTWQNRAVWEGSAMVEDFRFTGDFWAQHDREYYNGFRYMTDRIGDENYSGSMAQLITRQRNDYDTVMMPYINAKTFLRNAHPESEEIPLYLESTQSEEVKGVETVSGFMFVFDSQGVVGNVFSSEDGQWILHQGTWYSPSDPSNVVKVLSLPPEESEQKIAPFIDPILTSRYEFLESINSAPNNSETTSYEPPSVESEIKSLTK